MLLWKIVFRSTIMRDPYHQLLYTKSWVFHRILPSYWSLEVSVERDMLTGHEGYSSTSTPGPILFWICSCSAYWNYDYSRERAFNNPWYLFYFNFIFIVTTLWFTFISKTLFSNNFIIRFVHNVRMLIFILTKEHWMQAISHSEYISIT